MTAATRPVSFLTAVLSACMAFLVVSGPEQLVDPFLRNDDFPAYFRDAETYYLKTLQEGRWINYWWHLRPFDTPAWLNYLLFVSGSGVFAAALALHALRAAPLWLAALTAALIALSPQGVLMAGWFNTLIPGIWIVATYGVLALGLTPERGRQLLFLFVPLTLLAYSTYPLLLLLVCLARHDVPSTWRSHLRTVVTFVAAFALGMAIMYGMNWVVHGVFGLAYVDWRSARPADGVEGLAYNLPMVWDFYSWMFSGLGFARTWFAILNVSAFALAVAVIARRDPARAAALVTGAVLGLVMLTALALKDGIHIFFRATQFVWAAYAVALAEALVRLRAERNSRARLAGVIISLVLAVSAVFAAEVFHSLFPFQAETRRIAALVPSGSREIYVIGDYEAVPEVRTAHIQHETGLTYRLEALTGIRTVYCAASPDVCTVAAPPEKEPGNAIRVEARDGIAFVMLPNS